MSIEWIIFAILLFGLLIAINWRLKTILDILLDDKINEKSIDK